MLNVCDRNFFSRFESKLTFPLRTFVILSTKLAKDDYLYLLATCIYKSKSRISKPLDLTDHHNIINNCIPTIFVCIPTSSSILAETLIGDTYLAFAITIFATFQKTTLKSHLNSRHNISFL